MERWEEFEIILMQGRVRDILTLIEGSPLRPELERTPERVVNALAEMLDGYNVRIDDLFTTFEEEGKDMVIVVKDIPFVSWCEHHLLPFHGLASVAYLPVDKVIGASKIPRLVLAYAHRLQLQERMSRQIAETLMEKLQPQGVAVIIEAEHLCMQCRGVKSVGSKLITSVMLGEFRENANLRAEILSLLSIRKL